MKLGFVVLVYGKPDMVKECISFLKKINGIEEASIVVVDNCSPDNTYDLLTNWFRDEKNLYLLRNTSNQGFAKGNNLGYAYAREKLGCDYLIVMNSDVFIKDKQFIEHILEDKNVLNKYEIVGPDIVNLDEHHSNPLATTPLSNSVIRKAIFLNDISVLYYKLGIHRILKRKKYRRNYVNDPQTIVENILPHGACIIYTNKWVEKENKAFYPGTFLFCEELFLYDYIMKKNYKSIYWPSLVVNHIGDGSIEGDKPDKKIFINTCHRKSLKLLLKFRKDIIGKWEND